MEEVGFAVAFLTWGLSVGRNLAGDTGRREGANVSHLDITQRGTCQTESKATARERGTWEKELRG